MTSFARLATGAAALAVVSSCLEIRPQPTEPVDGEVAWIVVYGQVIEPNGSAVAGVRIDVTGLRPSTCDDQMLYPDRVVTDATGRYRATIGNWGTGFTVCVRAAATPPDGSGLLADSISMTPVTIRSPASDSLRLDIQIRSP